MALVVHSDLTHVISIERMAKQQQGATNKQAEHSHAVGRDAFWCPLHCSS